MISLGKVITGRERSQIQKLSLNILWYTQFLEPFAIWAYELIIFTIVLVVSKGKLLGSPPIYLLIP